VISLNPLGLAFDVYAGEYEHRLARRSTLGGAVSFYSPRDWSYLSMEGKYRYYPQGAALRGVSVGGTLGVTRIASRYGPYECDPYTCSGGLPNESYAALTLGFEIDYQWLLGEKQDFVIATGIGAKRFFGSKFINDGLYGITKALPVVRLSVGYSF
jgi:hypothetical protein